MSLSPFPIVSFHGFNPRSIRSFGRWRLGATPQKTHTHPHTFTVSGREFLMDGKPYQIIAGEMHYARIPREYWRDRLHKAKAMGLNTPLATSTIGKTKASHLK